MKSSLKELSEFAKWLFDNSLSAVFLTLKSDRETFDPDLQGEIRYMEDELEKLKQSYSPNALENSQWGRFRFYVDEFDDKLLGRKYEKRNYEKTCPVYTFCSWRLNKEFRMIHDELCAYLS